MNSYNFKNEKWARIIFAIVAGFLLILSCVFVWRELDALYSEGLIKNWLRWIGVYGYAFIIFAVCLVNALSMIEVFRYLEPQPCVLDTTMEEGKVTLSYLCPSCYSQVATFGEKGAFIPRHCECCGQRLNQYRKETRKK